MTRYALVIGISQYKYLNSLPTPTNDAEIIAQILEKYGNFQQVRRYPYRRNIENNNCPEIVNQEVTGISVMQQLQEFLSKQAEDSEALIYFTGHGITVSPYLGNSEGFLAASDCQLEKDGSRIIGQKNGISFSKLNEEIRNSHLSNLVVILDCCHSGYFIARNLLESSFNAFSAQKDYYLIAGCRSFQQGKIIKGESHSVFTTALIKAFSEENADPKRSITGDRLFDSISRELYGSVQEAIRFGWGKSIQLLTYPPQDNDLENIEITLNIDNPYLGLKSFDLEQAYLFHGRQNAVRALLERLTNSRFLAVIGASGCGKSSLVKAGLLHELSDNYFAGSSNWKREILTPGSHPLYKLQEVLDHHPDNLPYILFIDQFEEVFTLTQSEEERIRFIQLIANEVTNQEKQTRVIIAMRGDFLDKCAEYPEAANLINQNQITSYLVQPLSLEELEDAIAQPARLHGVTFESGLVSKIIDDVAQQPGALPLMQYALKELWDACIQDKSHENSQLTFAGYQKIGEVKGALEKTADRFYKSLTSKNEKKFIQRLFTLELVHLGEGKEVTRKRADRKILTEIAGSQPQLDHLINRLAETRLIVITDKTIEVSHEALFTHWPLLKGWIEDNRTYIRLRQKLESDCRSWREDYHKSDNALLTGAILANLEDWKKETSEKFSPEEEEYINRSIEKRDKEEQEAIARIERELEQEKKLKEQAEARAKAEAERKEEAEARVKAEKLRKRFALFGVFSSLSLTLLISLQTILVIRNAKIAADKSIARVEQLSRNNFQLEALRESIQVLDLLKSLNQQNNTDFLQRLQRVIDSVQERNRLENNQNAVLGVSISPDGKKIISASADGIINLWDMQTGKLLNTIQGHQGKAWSVRFSHKAHSNKNLIASTGFDKKVKLWRISKNNKLNNIASFEHKDRVYDVSFNSSETILASSSKDGNINFFNIRTNQIISTLDVKKIIVSTFNRNQEFKSGIYSLDFHPTQQIIAFSGYEEGGLYVYNLNQKDSIRIINPNQLHQQAITMVRFSPDGKYLASASFDGMIKIWDTNNLHNNSQPLAEIQAHNESIFGLAFNADSDMIASASLDKTIKIWNIGKVLENPKINKSPLKTSDYVQIIQGHTEMVNRIEFNPEFHINLGDSVPMLISSSNDKTIRIWNWTWKNETKEKPNIQLLLRKSCSKLKEYSPNHNLNNICP